MRNSILIALCVIFFYGCTATEIQSTEDIIISKIYYSSGVLRSVWETRNGKLNGIKREYNQDGILTQATNYKNDQIDGFQNAYFEDGSIWTKELYENGKKLQRFEYDADGYLISEEVK